MSKELTLKECLQLVDKGLDEYYSLTETFTSDEMTQTENAFNKIWNYIIEIDNLKNQEKEINNG